MSIQKLFISPTRSFRNVFFGIIFLVALFRTLSPQFLSGELFVPPDVGDGPDYENLAFNLVGRSSFGFDWSDNSFRAPYLEANEKGYYSKLLQKTEPFYLSAYRPPLFPAIIALEYNIFGRNFFSIRITNCLFSALAAAVSSYAVFLAIGFIPALLSASVFLFDSALVNSASKYLTESTALLISALLLLQLVLLIRESSGSKRRFFILGCILGVAVLTRSIMLVWIPFILLAVVAVGSKSRLKVLAITMATTLAILIPWAVRNYIVTDKATPLGTLGGVSLAADYSDEIISTRGIWLGKVQQAIFQPYYDSLSMLPTGLQKEISDSMWGQSRAKAWIAGNVSKIPELIVLKSSAYLWYTRSLYQKIVFICALVGFLAALRYRKKYALLIALPCIANLVAVALTHMDPDGRFSFPMLPYYGFFVGMISAPLVKRIEDKSEENG